MLTLDKRIKMMFEDVTRWLPDCTDADVLARMSRQYYMDITDSGNYFTGVVSDEVERGSKWVEDHIRAPGSLFKLRYTYDRDSLTNFEKFTEYFLKDRYTIRITGKQNVLVKHTADGVLPTKFVYDSVTSHWWIRNGTTTLYRTETFPLRDMFPRWYLALLNITL